MVSLRLSVRSITWKDITFINVPFPVRLAVVHHYVVSDVLIAVDLYHAKVRPDLSILYFACGLIRPF